MGIYWLSQRSFPGIIVLWTGIRMTLWLSSTTQLPLLILCNIICHHRHHRHWLSNNTEREWLLCHVVLFVTHFNSTPYEFIPSELLSLSLLFCLSIRGTHAGVLRLMNFPSQSHLPFKSTHDKVRVVAIRIPTLLSNSSANHSKSSHQHNHPQINGYLIHVCKNHFRFDEVAIFHDGTFKEMRKRATNDTSLYSLTHPPSTGEPHNLLLYLLDGFQWAKSTHDRMRESFPL